ncbi:MAG: methyltransferase domain-containing protein [Mesorhizobium sp.]|nr:methyltransferase domain-containing protein [Mesorhizobium sp.]
MGLNRDQSGLHRRRVDAVLDEVRASGARSVLDLGCGDGDLLVELAGLPDMERLWGFDPDAEAIRAARLRLEALRTTLPGDVRLDVRSLTDQPELLRGFDCAVLLEVIEHIDPKGLPAVESALFSAMRPGCVVLTTPNSEYNPLLGVPEDRFRHRDHRFEWDRGTFEEWGRQAAEANGYDVLFRPVPEGHRRLGGPSQMAVFTKQV